MKHIHAFRILLLVLLLLGSGATLSAQSGNWDSHILERSRSELESLLEDYDRTIASPAYSSALRDQAKREAALIRERLSRGDFQEGDQIALMVEGEESLSGGFVVQAGPKLVLPSIGDVSLEGVLRSELRSHLEEELSRYIRNPNVQARSSIRVLVTGGVGTPGYHVIPTNLVFSDLLGLAGGTTQTAQLQKIRVERSGQVIWRDDALQQAIIQGRTVDQLSIRAGDEIIVPNTPAKGAGQTLRDIAFVVSPIIMITTALLRVF